MSGYYTHRHGKRFGKLRERFVRDAERFLNQRIGKQGTPPWPRRFTPAGATNPDESCGQARLAAIRARPAE